MKILLKDLFKTADELGGKKISVSGWIRTMRVSKMFGFIELNDGTFFKNVQVVFEQDKIDNFKEISSLNVGAAITVEGNLELTPNAKQPFEIKAESVFVEGMSTHE